MQSQELRETLACLPDRAKMAVAVGDQLFELEKVFLVRQNGNYVTILHTGEEIDGKP